MRPVSFESSRLTFQTQRFPAAVLARFAFPLAACLIIFSPSIAWAQDTAGCSLTLADAESAYFNGDFERAVTLLQPCLETESYTVDEGIQAYALLGQIQYVLGEEASARAAVEGIYRLDANYEPDPQLAPNFTSFILETKQDMIVQGTFPSEETEVTPPVVPDPILIEEEGEITEAGPDEEGEETGLSPESEEEASARAQRRRKIMFFGGGAALAAVASAAILLSGGPGDDPGPGTSDWPLPPSHPQ